MEATKNLCAQLPKELHDKVTKGKDESGLNLSDYVEKIFTEYYDLSEKGGRSMSSETRTLALQISAELMGRLKAHLKTTKMTQKDFIIQIIEKSLDEAEKMVNEEILSARPTEEQNETEQE